MAVRILENYMKANAAAVLTVVESVEKLRTERGGISSPEVAAAISVAMYGAPPKPAAGNVASIVSPPRKRKRLVMGYNSPPRKRKRLVVEDKSLADDVVLLMSVARQGIESNRKRAEAAAENIGRIMREITTAPAACTTIEPYVDTLDKVFVGLNNDYTPCVDCTKYTLSDSTKNITLASFHESTVLDSVEKSLRDVLSKVQERETSKVQEKEPSDNLRQYIKNVATNISMNSIILWADGVESVLKECAQSTPSPSNYFPLISRHASEVRKAVQRIKRLVGESYCKMPATQLISAGDISEFRQAADTCYSALMAETHERIVSNLLFYVNFKVVEGNKQDYVKNRLGTMAGTVREPIRIERRDTTETLFGLCFMFKIMPREFTECVLTFPSANLSSYHGRSGTHLTPLLSYYGPRFEDSWVRFKDVLWERSEAVRKSHERGKRIDYVDATANLTGLVYVLVLDVANAFQAQRTCAYKLLNEIKEQYKLWNKFVHAQ